jgi:hypothetical protein
VLHDVRYVVASVISYCGGAFSEFPCFAGFMERDSLKSGKKFEPQSVRIKFEMNADTTSVLPLVFDLQEHKVVFADISSGGSSATSAIGTSGRLATQARAIMELPLRKPTALEVLREHVAARGSLASNVEEADVAWMAHGLDMEWLLTMAA